MLKKHFSSNDSENSVATIDDYSFDEVEDFVAEGEDIAQVIEDEIESELETHIEDEIEEEYTPVLVKKDPKELLEDIIALDNIEDFDDEDPTL